MRRRSRRGRSICSTTSPRISSESRAIPAPARAPATSTRSTKFPTRAGSPIASSRGRCRWRKRRAVRSPARGRRPAPGRSSGPKQAGFAPGFTMRDAKGELWFVSFDAKGFPEAATGAILVANKIFWTLGYWQVENFLVSVRLDQLVVAESATVTSAVRQGASDAAQRPRGRAEAIAPQSRRLVPRHRRPRRSRAPARRVPLLRHAPRRSRTTSCRTSTGASCAR